jgi:hypothetical protein
MRLDLLGNKVILDEAIHPIRFLLIASFLDKPTTIKAMNMMRVKWSVGQEYVSDSDESVLQWKHTHLKMSADEMKKKKEVERKFRERYCHNEWLYEPETSEHRLKYENARMKLMCSDKWRDFNNDLDLLLDRSRKTKNFRRVMERAVLCNTVKKTDILPPIIRAKMDECVLLRSPFRSMELVIEFDPFTTEKELLEAFRQRKKVNEKDPYLRLVIPRIYNPKHIPEIRRNRDWYWRNLNGESVTDIAYSDLPESEKLVLGNNWTKNQLKNYRGVANAIVWYKKLLR